MKIEELTAYEVLEKRRIDDIDSESWLLRHKKTGARVALLENNDDNKVFYIGFRTPPKDSTGVAHIIEHSVLCGSEHFPVKDPFVELVKGSLNTFLNAMTYPDKTVYPVASTNDKDFSNLVHVYLDAVFRPNIYRNPSIFRQEGWHYELSEEGELSVNGVVYNEMKGAFSAPDDVLAREIMRSLYPDTTYGFESGGDPEVIPELTYEDFLNFHKTYYHPSNSYIYLYGKMDMAEKLAFLDEEYLSGYESLDVNSEIDVQGTFAEPGCIIREYPVDEGEKEEESAYLSVNYSIGDNLDRELYVAFQVIDFALGTATGAPLKEALINKGIGKEVYSSYDNGIMQPYFSIVAKDTSLSRKQEFLDTINEVLEKIVKEGFDKKTLLAAINYYEFKYREADFGSYPKGLMYGLQMLDSWIYDSSKPFIHIEANDTFRILRERVETGYFEELVDRYLCKNTHQSQVMLKPKQGMAEEMDEKLRVRLAEKKAGMTEEELQEIRDTFAALTAFQEQEDSPEDLAKIPLLKREDLRREAEPVCNEERTVADRRMLYHNVYTNGIAYLRFLFSLDNIPGECIPYVGMLNRCIGEMNTAKYSYGDLFTEINLVTGGIQSVIGMYRKPAEIDSGMATLEIKTKVLYGNIEEAMKLIEEIAFTTEFGDEKRLLEILRENKSRIQSDMISAGHAVAASRSASYTSVPAALLDELTGLGFYRVLCDYEEHFEEKKGELAEKLKTAARMVFRRENLMVDYTGEEKALAEVERAAYGFAQRLYTEPVEKAHYVPVLKKKNEGLMSASQVQYVCRSGNFRKHGLSYHGGLRALKVMLGYEYLWVNVRVKGGAYGCMCNFGASGESYFVSYRDPNLTRTVEVFEKAAEFIRNYQADERTMTQYIIGAVSDMDTPLTPAAKGDYSRNVYLAGETVEDVQKRRDELLSTTPETIRGLAAYIEAFMGDECLCVTGNSGKLKENKEIFGKLENLF